MRETPKAILMVAPLLLMFLFSSCEALAGGPDVALWLARSCVGEAGFDSASTGECAAIMHIYAKRSKVSGSPLYKVIRKYSAAVNPRANTSRPWVLTLRRDMKKPNGWNPRLSWENHKRKWFEVLTVCDAFVRGEVVDPIPLADHYGGWVDLPRARRAGWFRVPAPFKNYFWSVSDPTKKENQ